MNRLQIKNAVGLFSLVLGLAEMAVPDRVARLAGLDAHDTELNELRLVGLREIGNALGLLSSSRARDWFRLRMVGDVMDLTLLGRAYSSTKHANQQRFAVATAAVLGILALDWQCETQSAQDASQSDIPLKHGIQVTKSITINRPLTEVYTFWRNFENLPSFMSHLEDVQVTDPRHSHWKAKAPAGLKVEWDAEIVEDLPEQMIMWHALEGGDLNNAGTVEFRPAPANRGTEVWVDLRYDAPGGKAGALLAKLFAEEPDIQIMDDLRAFKQVMETGEVLRADGSAQGRRLLHKPAQPHLAIP